MTNRKWILLIGAFCLVCLAASLLLPRAFSDGGVALVYSDGALVMTLDLSESGDYPVTSAYGTNVLHVADGKLSVGEASCANQDCTRHAPAASGMPIVCLPNRLVVRFTKKDPLDAIVG